MPDQASLGDFGDEGGDGGTEGRPSWVGVVSDDATFDDDSCPWCLHPSSGFTTELSGGDWVACGNCESRIPTEADWYQRGEKIVV